MIRMVSDMLRADPDRGGTSSGGSSGGIDDDAENDAWLALQLLMEQNPDYRQIDANHFVGSDGRIRMIVRGADGKPKFGEKWTAADSQRFLKSAGVSAPSSGGSSGGGGGGGGSTTDDPRYWENKREELDLEWAQLDQDERQEAERLAFQYQQAGMDAETARRQALAQLIQNRNDNSVNLARTSGEIAAQAAQFAANPRDAIAELQYRNATEAGPAFGSIGNTEFGGYTSKLDDKFQQMFGGVAGDLSRAREFVGSIPPTEFFGAETRTQLGLPLLPQQEMAGFSPPNPLDGLVQKLQGMAPQDQEAFRRYTDPQYREQQTRIEDAYAKDPVAAQEFFRKIAEMNGGVPAPAAEDGINMNIHEPAAVVGMSGKVYATMAENDPEQLRVIPLPSVKKRNAEREKREKERQKSGASVRDGDAFHAARKQFLEETQGAQRMSKGGQMNFGADLTDAWGGNSQPPPMFRDTRWQPRPPLGGWNRRQPPRWRRPRPPVGMPIPRPPVGELPPRSPWMPGPIDPMPRPPRDGPPKLPPRFPKPPRNAPPDFPPEVGPMPRPPGQFPKPGVPDLQFPNTPPEDYLGRSAQIWDVIHLAPDPAEAWKKLSTNDQMIYLKYYDQNSGNGAAKGWRPPGMMTIPREEWDRAQPMGPLADSRDQFLAQTAGVPRMAGGGTVTIDSKGRVTSPNPFGKEVKGLTGPIGVGYKRGPNGEKIYQRASTYTKKGKLAGVGIAQYLRAGGKLNLGGRKRGGGGGGITPGVAPKRGPGGFQGVVPGTAGSGSSGGTNPVVNDFMGNIRQQLATLGAPTPGGQSLPDPRMLADGVYSRLETDPVLKAYIEAAFSRAGIDPATLWNTAKQYRPTGLNTGGGIPSVRFM